MGDANITDINNPSELLDSFCSPYTTYAWPLYDDDPSPEKLSGVDLTAPALVSYPIRAKYLNEMGCDGSAYTYLVAYMRDFVAAERTSRFCELAQVDIEALSSRQVGDEIQRPQDWQAFVRCLDAVEDCYGLTSVAVTKILHRKRPDLLPIDDSRLRGFYKDGPP